MVRSRKQSKRMPIRKQYKIAKKVKEHNRKMKKAAKQNPATKRLKKDPGIPNLFPFKEQLLKQLEEKKQAVASERQRLKLQRKSKAKKSIQGLRNEAQRKTREFEKKQALQSASLDSDTDPNRRSVRAYRQEFRQVLERADVVLEVLDARDPLGSRCCAVEQAVMATGVNKKLILVLNKIDLIPRQNAEAWLKHLRNELPTIAFKACTQTQKQNLSQRKYGLGTAPGRVLASSACLGAELLLKLLGNYCRNEDIKTSIIVGVVGLPNVGKSSIINSLKRSKACAVGATPGVTKSLQEIQLDKHVKLLDSPGVVMATGSGDSASLILRNCVKLESVSDPVPPVEAILLRCSRLLLMEHYRLAEFDSCDEFLSHLARRRGKLKKGGIPDTNAAARQVLRDWNTGRIKFYTHPPEQHTLPTHISAQLVQEWGEAFNVKSLETEEKQQLSGLPEKMETAILVESEGMVTEVYEEEEEEEEEEGEGEEEESEVEEMGSELSDSDDEESEDMDEENPANKTGEVTVVFPKKEAKKQVSTKQKAPKNRAKGTERIARDEDVMMENSEAVTDSYDFNEYF